MKLTFLYNCSKFLLLLFLPWHLDIVLFDIFVSSSADVDCAGYECCQPEISLRSQFLQLLVQS